MARIYWDNPYVFQIDTLVTEARLIDGRLAIACTDQLVHPAGGGQPRDSGAVVINGSRMEVIDLKRQKGKLWLVLSGVADPLDVLGQIVACEIDAARRLRMMRLHTLSHIGMAGLRVALGNTFASRGMDISDGSSVVHLRFDAEHVVAGRELDTIAEFIRSAIERDLPVEAQTYKSLDAAQGTWGSLFRVDPNLEFSGRVRVICIAGVDANPCGGTHIRRLGEIGSVHIVNVREPSEGKPFTLDLSL